MKTLFIALSLWSSLLWANPWEAGMATGNPIIDTVWDAVPNPLAKNWEMSEARLAPNRYAFSLKLKRFHTGGAGEAFILLKTRAQVLQQTLGLGNYSIEEYNEGVLSHTMGARRVAYGVIAFEGPNAQTENIIWPEEKTGKRQQKINLKPGTQAQVRTHPVPAVTEVDGVQLCLTPCADILEK